MERNSRGWGLGLSMFVPFACRQLGLGVNSGSRFRVLSHKLSLLVSKQNHKFLTLVPWAPGHNLGLPPMPLSSVPPVFNRPLALKCPSLPNTGLCPEELLCAPRCEAPEKRVSCEVSAEARGPRLCFSPSRTVSSCQHKVLTHKETPTGFSA